MSKIFSRLFFAALLGSLATLWAAERTDFNAGWQFARFGKMGDGSTRAEPAHLESPQASDADWRTLDLPHDWAIEGPFRMDLPAHTGRLPLEGVGWYRKRFEAPHIPQGGRLYLDVDGAMMMPKVWLNGRFVGEWAYGYTPFRMDLTPYLQPGENVLAVRVENMPYSSRWYPGSGLYRNVWLTTTGPVAVDNGGVFVRSSGVSAESATVEVGTLVRNDGGAPVTVKVRQRLRGPDGAPAAVLESLPVEIPRGGARQIDLSCVLKSPRLWDVENPNLYTCLTEVMVGDAVVDSAQTRFGIRETRWSAKDGFFLNDRRVPIRGVCLHHDLGAIGAAFNVSAARRQLRIMKEMGCNAVRTSHNPPAAEFLDLCDELGLLVMVDVFDGWRLPKGENVNDYSRFFDQWHERDIVNTVRRDRNHPSVILWCSGNEIVEFGKGTPENLALSRALTALFHREDPTRPVTVGNNYSQAFTNGFMETVDVAGYNYKAVKAKTPNYLTHIERYPNQPLVGSETSSCISSRGEYFFPVGEKLPDFLSHFQVSSYDWAAPRWAYAPDVEFDSLDRFPQVAGEFVWTGFDYLGEPTPYTRDTTNILNVADPAQRQRLMAQFEKYGDGAPSRSSYFGIVDLAGLPKDRYYLYQSRWRADMPMAHILPHWTWPGREGEITPVYVYTSGDEAELFLNSQSLGRKKRGPLEYRFRWDDVRYAPGELSVRTWRNGQPWAQAQVRTAGPLARIAASADRAELPADARTLCYITLEAFDAQNTPVPGCAAAFAVETQGPVEFVAADNGDATDLRTFSEPTRSLYNGKAVVIVRAKRGSSGTGTVKITSPGLPPQEISLEVGP